MMSCVPVDRKSETGEACANCGKDGSDTVKLKNCTACRIVKYCGVDCQRAHRKQHKRTCKQRAAELKDEELYGQGHERLEGDFCPICTLPIPLPMDKHSGFNTCCMKTICHGCALAASKRGMGDCPFCRTPLPANDAENTEILAMVRARVAKKDPVAINHLGEKYFFGQLGLQKDVSRAIALWTKAAELGSVKALYNLGVAYNTGEGVQQDTVKAVEFYEKAAMQGSADARHNLGCCEVRMGNSDRAVRHFLISAKMGHKHECPVAATPAGPSGAPASRRIRRRRLTVKRAVCPDGVFGSRPLGERSSSGLAPRWPTLAPSRLSSSRGGGRRSSPRLTTPPPHPSPLSGWPRSSPDGDGIAHALVRPTPPKRKQSRRRPTARVVTPRRRRSHPSGPRGSGVIPFTRGGWNTSPAGPTKAQPADQVPPPPGQTKSHLPQPSPLLLRRPQDLHSSFKPPASGCAGCHGGRNTDSGSGFGPAGAPQRDLHLANLPRYLLR
ncbi:hypothetical protein THAOC_14055 [Thalassiosira oceanica]|uniref:MYND-type domain-containing protein n=1 Tax=Thalassiosira oceanica TaxID=159749 RepID=K0SG81_THAOC|nr:hypothetical protein THAOC_14055 [Thalassiosira oceanica]|eukprot:EJK65128.1 hypothetical protein THAOC_14055 [Thalassiosira oceanica]